MPEAHHTAVPVVILTALPVEYEAVLAHLQDAHQVVHEQGTIYEQGIFTVNGASYTVAVGEIGAGNTTAALETERAIRYFRPRLILFVGVAGGLKDVKLGDVVAASKIYNYESGKDMDESFQLRPELYKATYPMEQLARFVARKAWWKRLPEFSDSSHPQAFVGPLAAGAKVVASFKSATWKLIHSSYGDSLGVEMEGYGFSQVAYANSQVEAIVVRGISDLIEGKSEADGSGSQERASRHASAFAFELVAAYLGRSGGGQPAANQSQPVVNQPQPAAAQAAPDARTVTSAAATQPAGSKRPVSLYYIYADEDRTLLELLQNQLAVWVDNGQLSKWDRSKIRGGQPIAAQILQHLDQANIVLPLVSSNLFGSKRDEVAIELKRLKELVDVKLVTVLPILTRPTAGWNAHPLFKGLQFLPGNNKSLTEGSRDRQISNAVTGIVREALGDQ